jgi:aspartate aminotransferase-like enzyme
MIPGPTPVVDSIRTEMGRDTIAFGDPDFVKDYKEVIDVCDWHGKAPNDEQYAQAVEELKGGLK